MRVKKQLEIKPGDVRCPRCYSIDLVPSLPRGIWDTIMLMLNRVPRHCRFCEKRFYVHREDVCRIPQP